MGEALVKLTLKQEEDIIERGFVSFMEVGNALGRIQEGRKYYPGYPTFADYMNKRWGWSRQQGYLQIQSAQIGQLLSDVNHGLHQVTCERQIRPLSKLRLPDDSFDYPRIQEAWGEACHLAQEANDGIPRPPKASEVKYVVDEMLYVPTPPLPEGKYGVIYADPPWRFDNTGFEQSAASHYPTMKTEEIAALSIPDARALFLWATCAMLEDSLYVMKEWGFDYKTNMVWLKDKGPSMGWYLRTRHELLLIGTNPNHERLHPEYKPHSIIDGKVTRHSAKPVAVYGIIEKMYDGPYLELFAREKREGWESWGNEV